MKIEKEDVKRTMLITKHKKGVICGETNHSCCSLVYPIARKATRTVFSDMGAGNIKGELHEIDFSYLKISTT